eukprot:Skav220366  [mRNA]  locus=scaffold609:111533:115978:+ [translate_table: standard]
MGHCGRHGAPLGAEEYLFITIYSLELLLRIMAYGCAKCCRDGWFLFDAILASRRVPWSPQEGHQAGTHGELKRFQVPLINAKPELQVYFLILLLAVGLAQRVLMLGQVEGFSTVSGIALMNLVHTLASLAQPLVTWKFCVLFSIEVTASIVEASLQSSEMDRQEKKASCGAAVVFVGPYETRDGAIHPCTMA